jgi:hypothetical protein
MGFQRVMQATYIQAGAFSVSAHKDVQPGTEAFNMRSNQTGNVRIP